MATPIWQPGTLYPPGSIVRPTGPLLPPVPVLTNATFDSNATGWTLTGSAVWSATGGFGSAGCVQMSGGVGSVAFTTAFACLPGQVITATCMIATPTGSSGNTGDMNINWFTSGMVFISQSQGNIVNRAGGTGYRLSSITAAAPATAAFYQVVGDASPAGGGVVRFDNFTAASSGGAVPAGLVYKAVQAGVGTSASTEPVWPTTVGPTVVDNTVTWQAVIATRITYVAKPILKSGGTEPTWPLGVGASVPDGTISWLSDSRQVVQAPNSKVVAITASKVYAADEDIIRYSATVNPLDWTTTDDAGYLPSGLNQNGSNDTAVVNIYRGSLVSFSSTTFQNWQVDPDPANMSLLDVMEGIGSTWQHAAQPVAKDLFYLAKLGVRTVGISAGSTNLVNGDVGMPIDPLVRDSVKSAEYNDTDVLGLYYPSLGQYWLTFPDFPPPEMFVSGSFASWTTLTDYSGTVSFVNEVGLVSVAWTGGEPLPVGATLAVDNTAKTVILTLPLTSAGVVGSSYDFTFILTDAIGRTVSASRSVAVALPALSLTGSLSTWVRTNPYAVSLSIGNAIGDCAITSVTGSSLPINWYVVADNPNSQVDIGGPSDITYPTGSACFNISIQDSAGRTAIWAGCFNVIPVAPEWDLSFKSPAAVLSAGNLRLEANTGAAGTYANARSTLPIKGLAYMSGVISSATPGSDNVGIGIADVSVAYTNGAFFIGDSAMSVAAWSRNGDVYVTGLPAGSIGAQPASVSIEIAVRVSTRRAWVRANGGAWVGGGDPISNTSPTWTLAGTGQIYMVGTVSKSGATSSRSVVLAVDSASTTGVVPTGFTAANWDI